MNKLNSSHIILIFLVFGSLIAYFLLPRHRPKIRVIQRYIILIFIAILILSPFFWLISAVFKDSDVLMQYSFLPPLSEWSSKTLNLKNFYNPSTDELDSLFEAEKTIRGEVHFWRYLLNSLFLASSSTMITLFFSSLGGFALAKYDFVGKAPIIYFMLGTMMIPGMLLLAPLYNLIYKIGWMDTYWALLVPGASSAFGMFLFRQACMSVPNSLLEAARIDGCSEFNIYLNIVMHLVRPMTGAFCLVSFLGNWNSFVAPNIYIQTQAKLTLPVILNQFVGVYSQQYGIFLAGTLIAIIPPAILFFALQREFISGLTSGAIKG